MADRFKVTGLIAATYTPLGADDRIALDRVAPMVEHLIADEVDGLYVCGSTGEGMSLTTAERCALTAEFVRAAAGRVPVIVQAGHNCLEDGREIARHAQKVGATAISATCPSYYRLESLEVLVETMAKLASAAPDLPFYYYHIPVMTHADFDMVAFLRLAEQRIPNLAGLKYSKPTVHEYQRCLEFGEGRFDILWGVDEMLLSALTVGAEGAVGSTYNLFAPLYQQLRAAFTDSNLTEARRLQGISAALVAMIAQFPFHPAMKFLLARQGIECGPPRLPLRALGSREGDTLQGNLAAADLLKWIDRTAVARE